jgi:hypothetical protein
MKSSRRFTTALTLLLSLLIVVPFLADYIGPDRTETIYVNRRLRCHYEAVYDPAGPGYYSCTMNLYYPPGSSCPSNVASYFNPTACVGWSDSCTSVPCSISSSSSIVSCTAGETGCRSVAQTVTHPPATISGNINCPQTGDNGYCTAAASLSLSGNEPLSGYSIIALEGTHNGTTFACSGDSCSINLTEGGNSFTFWALSDWGDSSERGSANRGVDTRPPSISASASGTPGSGSWYVSAVTIDASASDPSPGSSLASFQAAVDGGGWSTYSGTITLNDGSHTVELLARDDAGWTDSASMSFQIDTVAPTTVITDPAGTTWATGTIAISGVTSDLNLSSAEISYNGGSSWSGLSPDGSGSWSTNWDTQTVSNGSYSVHARGRDEAGNVGESDSVTIMVDNGEPRIYIPDSWPIWQTVAINVVDNGIGVDRVRLTIHAGSYGERVYNWNSGQDEFRWDRYIDGVSMPIGGYPVEVEAWDRVGNKGAAWGEIVIPAPDEVEEEKDPGVLSVEPSEEPTEPPSTSGGGEPASQPTNTPEPPKVVLFGGESSSTGESSGAGETGAEEITPPAGSSNLLVGAAAVAAVGTVMAVVAVAKKKREDEEKKEAAAAAMFNKQQIALEEKQAQKAAQAKWEAEQEAARLEAEREAIKAEREAQGITTGQPAPPYFVYVEAEKQRQREEDLRKRKEEEKQEQLRAQKEAFRQADSMASQHTEDGTVKAPPTGIVKWIGKGGKFIKGLASAFDLRKLSFTRLPSGHVSVSAPGVPAGEKLAYRTGEDVNIPGTRYKPTTLSWTTLKSLGRRAFNGIKTNLGVSAAVNAYDYLLGSNKGGSLEEFTASTVVDTAVATGVGIGSATAVGLGSTIYTGVAAALGATAVAPFAVVAGVTVIVGLGVSLAVDHFFGEEIAEIKQKFGATLDAGLSAWKGIRQNVNIIGQHVSENIQNTVNNTIENVRNTITNVASTLEQTSNNIGTAVDNAIDNVKTAVGDAAKSVGDFFGGLFGGK